MSREGMRVLQHFLRALPHPVVAFDSDGLLTACNPLAADLFGYAGGELPARRCEDLFDVTLSDFAPAADDGLSAHGDWKNVIARKANGQTVPLAVCAGALAGSDTRITLLTLRKGREQLFAPSRGIVESLLQNNDLPFVYVNARGIVLAANPAFGTALGVPHSSVHNQPVAQVPLPRDLLDGLKVAFERREVSAGGATPFCSMEGNDEPRYWDWFLCPITDRRQASVGAVILLLEATARVKAEQAFKKSTLEWTYAMDAFEDCIYLVDMDDRLVRANKAFYKLAKCRPEDVIGRTVSSIMHPAGEPFPCPVCEARLERRDAYIIMEADNPNNKTGRPNELMVRMIRDDSGTVIGVLMGLRDLSRTRQTEQEFRRLNDHIRLLLGSTGEGIFGIDTEGRCTFINRAGAEILGYSPDEIEDRELHRLIHYAREDGTPYPIDECPMIRTIREGASIRSTSEVLWRKDGSAMPVHYLCNPVIDKGWVTGAVVVFRDVTETRAMTRRLDYLATHDTLTGLFNRHEFERRLDHALARCRREGTSHVLCYCDLDQFKVVNDTCGHTAGDHLLYQLSALLTDHLPPNATLARLGGDEFGLLLADCGLESARSHIDALRDTVREFRFPWQDKTFAIGMSIGVVPLDATLEGQAAAMSLADAACYMAKDSGRNRVHIYQAGDADLSRRHREMQWVTRIQNALEHNRFELHFQLIRATAPSAQPCRQRFEILLRLRDADGEIVLPDAFLSSAERFNLMPAVDRWVIGETFQWLNAQAMNLANVDLCTINVSGHSMSDEVFLDFVVNQLRDLNIPAHKICFEITETAAVAHLGRATHFMRELKSRGCQFALDDFGSGMSSFAYLKNLPVDYLKIDGNFVRDVADDPVDYAMVDAINKVGHVMGLQTVAEFVEDAQVLDKLRSIGVDYVQGFGIAPPAPLVGAVFSR